MRHRVPRPSWAALLGLLLLAAAPAAAQRAEVDEVRRFREGARAKHHESLVEILRLSQAVQPLEKKLAEATSVVQRLEREEPGLFRDRQLRQARLAAKAIGNDLARVKTMLDSERDTEKVRRLELIMASWELVNRLFEVAERAESVPRLRQAQAYRDQAMEVLGELDSLEALEEKDLPGPPAVAPIDPATPLEDLRWFVEFYERLRDGAVQRDQELAPIEAERKKLVAHLEKLWEKGYSVEERLTRERERLNKVEALRDRFRARAQRYQDELKQLEKLIKALEKEQG